MVDVSESFILKSFVITQTNKMTSIKLIILSMIIIGDPYEGNVISWITPNMNTMIVEDANIIERFLADFHNRTIAITVNNRSAIPDITIEGSGTRGLPSRSEMDVRTDSMYVPIPKIASVLFFILFGSSLHVSLPLAKYVP